MKYSLNSTLTFGKYKDSTIAEIIKEDPNYLDWCLEEIDNFELDEEVQDKLDEVLDEEDWSDNDDFIWSDEFNDYV